MNLTNLRMLLLFLLLPAGTFAQKDTLINKLDSLSKKTDSAGGQLNNISPRAYNENTKITSGSYFILLGSNLKQSFIRPFHMKGKDWKKLGEFAIVAGVLGFADEPVQKEALRLRTNSPSLVNISNYVTNFGGIYEAVGLVAFGGYGFIFKQDKMQTTALLATQAYLTAGAVESVTKYLTGRTRPSFYPASTEAEPRFLGPFSKTAKTASGRASYSSFPSGHTTVAFAAATVFSLEYENVPIVPIIAYSSATLIGLSRIMENKHWTTDVFVGAALGYLTGRQVVNNYHRYAKLKAPNQKKNTVSFNLNYSCGHLEPGVVYKFR